MKGESVWLYGADGKRYLDVYNNVPNVGHCHPHVVEAICRQAASLNVHTRYLHDTLVEYGERLTAKFDSSLSMLFLTCTGSEANEVALRMARLHTGKQGIICSNATYHGNTTAVDALATMFNGGMPCGPGVRAVDFPDTYRAPTGVLPDDLSSYYVNQVRTAIAAFEQEGVGFAGMLICPIFANEGLPHVPDRYFEQVARLVREAGGVLIFDEVQSGFGRTGCWWGHEYAGVVPDIVTLGKPMGNGHPIAGAVCRPELGEAFRNKVMYFNTFGGNPVACAAGLAVLEVIENEKLVDNARDVGAYLKRGLQALAEHYPLIGDVRGCGLFFGVELVKDLESKTPAAAEARALVNDVKRNGVLISKIGMHDNILKLRPPICFDRDHADLLLNVLDDAFARARRECHF
ncbi:Isoleucine 2-epimerase [compost metagenome]